MGLLRRVPRGERQSATGSPVKVAHANLGLNLSDTQLEAIAPQVNSLPAGEFLTVRGRKGQSQAGDWPPKGQLLLFPGVPKFPLVLDITLARLVILLAGLTAFGSGSRLAVPCSVPSWRSWPPLLLPVPPCSLELLPPCCSGRDPPTGPLARSRCLLPNDDKGTLPSAAARKRKFTGAGSSLCWRRTACD
jgi:hypothetical protein